MTASGPAATSAAPEADGADGADGAAHEGTSRSARLALAVFLLALGAASLLVLLRLGRDRWFFSDEWNLIAGRQPGAFEDLFRANNAHWITLPAIAYDLMWRLVGIRSYVPYQAMSVATHAAVVVLVRAVMRRADVSPWMATVACAPVLIFAAGADNIVWAFQITNTGAIAFGLVQVLLADHDGPLNRRDALGLLAGLAALMCSGVALPMVAAAGLTAPVRRGWRAAAVHTIPLAAAYGTWVLLADPQSESPAGRPSVGDVATWIGRFVRGTFVGLGAGWVLGVVFAAVLVVGLVLTVTRRPRAEVRAVLAAPGALALAALAFSATTAVGRWHLGTQQAAGSRYVYVGGVLVLPLLAVAAQALADRWRPAFPLLVVAFLLPLPLGLDDVRDPLFGSAYFTTQRQAVSGAPYAPFADEVPDDARPLLNPFVTPDLDLGFLRGAEADGKLDAPTLPLPASLVEQLRVRLGLVPRPGQPSFAPCTPVTEPFVVTLEAGDVVTLRTPIDLVGIGPDGTRSAPVTYQPQNGARLEVVVPELQVEVRRPFGAREAQWCEPS